MPYSVNDDPTIPPPGRRTGNGADSVVPYLVKTLASKPKANAGERDETRPGTAARGAPDNEFADSSLPLDFRL